MPTFPPRKPSAPPPHNGGILWRNKTLWSPPFCLHFSFVSGNVEVKVLHFLNSALWLNVGSFHDFTNLLFFCFVFLAMTSAGEMCKKNMYIHFLFFASDLGSFYPKQRFLSLELKDKKNKNQSKIEALFAFYLFLSPSAVIFRITVNYKTQVLIPRWR